MKTIHKYTLDNIATPVVAMPIGAQILSVHEQRGKVCLWALVNPDNEFKFHHLFIYGTGHPAEHAERENYIGTVFLEGGALVFHIFEDATE